MDVVRLLAFSFLAFIFNWSSPFIACSAVELPCFLTPPYHSSLLISATFTKTEEIQIVEQLLEKHCEFRLLKPNEPALNEISFILLSETSLSTWKSRLPEVSTTVVSNDFGKVLSEAPKQQSTYSPLLFNSSSPRQGSNPSTPTLDTAFYKQYNTHEVLFEKWDALADRYEGVTRHLIGRSSLNRTIHVLRVGKTPMRRPRRLFINGLLHARDWISVPVAVYIIEQLAIKLARKEEPLTSLLGQVEVLAVPLPNIDGYVHTHEGDRLWSKNRRLIESSNGCRGVDLNRNWGFMFNRSGSSTNFPCNDNYIGPKEFSESETKVLRNFIRDLPGAMVHLNLESFGQLIVGPWAFSRDVPPNLGFLDEAGVELSRDISKVFPDTAPYIYSLRSRNPLTTQSSGVMTDWTFSQNITSFAVQLRPTRGDSRMFLVPEQEILPNCEEVFGGIQSLLRFIDDIKTPSDEEVDDGGGGEEGGDSDSGSDSGSDSEDEDTGSGTPSQADGAEGNDAKSSAAVPVYGIVLLAIGGVAIAAIVVLGFVVYRRRQNTGSVENA